MNYNLGGNKGRKSEVGTVSFCPFKNCGKIYSLSPFGLLEQIDNRHLFLIVLKVGKPRIKVQQNRCLVRFPFWFADDISSLGLT